jgi:hypothetical protein
MLLPSENVIAPEANNTPQIMLLLHMQIRRYFNKICDNELYSLFYKPWLIYNYWNLLLLNNVIIIQTEVSSFRNKLPDIYYPV